MNYLKIYVHPTISQNSNNIPPPPFLHYKTLQLIEYRQTNRFPPGEPNLTMLSVETLILYYTSSFLWFQVKRRIS